MDYKEVIPEGGENIRSFCKRLEKAAPAFAVFNDLKITANVGDTAEDLFNQYHDLQEVFLIHDS